jgi:serine/threonine-protein kinase HipA
MARRATAALGVFLNGRKVGVFTRQSTAAVDFVYDGDWLAWPSTFPISLSLPLREQRYAGDPVLAVFDNLLPDETPIRRAIAARVQARGDDAFGLLSVIGRDCVGALQFLPPGQLPGPAGAVEGRRLETHQIAALLAGLAQAPLGLGEDEDFRISLAGAQEKTALLRQDGAWWTPHGASATTHILKPQIGARNGMDLSQSVENEFFCMRLTKAVGLPVAKVEIETFGDQRALVIERFDRLWDGQRLLRLPQEDFCQALSTPPAAKYESHGGPGMIRILERLLGSDTASADRATFLKATVWFWLLGATDGHAKNFSIALQPGGGFALTPLYDILSTQPLVDAHQLRHNQFKLSMAVGDRRRYVIAQVAPRHFAQTAARAGIGRSVVETLFDELLAAVPNALASVLADLPEGFPRSLTASIVAGVERRLAILGQRDGWFADT